MESWKKKYTKPGLILLLLVLSLFQNGFAHDVVIRRYFKLNTGVILPYSDFAVKKFWPNAGFAKFGESMEIEYYVCRNSEFIFSYFLLGISAGYSNINFDKKTYIKEYNRVLDDNCIDSKIGNYSIYNASLNLLFVPPRYKNFEFQFCLKAGLSDCIHPQILINHEKYGNLLDIKKSSSLAYSRGWGVRIIYFFDDKYGISFNYQDYLVAPEYKNEYGYGFDVPMTYHNFSVGMTIQLLKKKS